MAKVIKINIDEEVDSIIEEIRKALTTSKFPNGKFTFTKDFGTVDKKAKLIYSAKAWVKTKLLVDHFSSEVAWHGIAHRVEGEDNTYKVEDLLVYPQEVTGATVTTDQEEYTKWLYAHDDDVFNGIRAQCHSHVNMGVTPSATDTDLYWKILGQLGPDDFYIFTIHNKKGDMTKLIYDMRDNLCFETKDVDLIIEGCEGFISDAENAVKRHATTYNNGYNSYNSGYNSGYGGSGYNSGGNSGYNSGYSGQYGGTSGYGGYTGGQQRGGAPVNTGKPAAGSVTPAGKGDQGQRFGYKKK